MSSRLDDFTPFSGPGDEPHALALPSDIMLYEVLVQLKRR